MTTQSDTTQYNTSELNQLLEEKAFQYTYYLAVSAVFLWLVWLFFDYYQAYSIFTELVIIRLSLSLGALFVVAAMSRKKINATRAQFLLYIPALTFLGFLFNYSPHNQLFTYILSGSFMVILTGFVFFIMPSARAVFYGVYSIIIIILFRFIVDKHSLIDFLLNGGILFISMTAFTVAYTSVRYKSIKEGFINKLIIDSTNKILEQQKEILKAKNLELESSLEEKELLLKEVHHRVKNNLQIVSSLLNLQNIENSDKSATDVLVSSQNRIQAMAILHKILYQSGSFKSVNVKNYFDHLAEYLESSMGLRRLKIKLVVHTNIDELTFDKLIPLGLIVNELITNSIKHAFEDKDEGLVSLELLKNHQDCTLFIRDNGKGFDGDFFAGKNLSLGFKLIYGLANQLKGEVSFPGVEKGTCVKIEFKDCLF